LEAFSNFTSAKRQQRTRSHYFDLLIQSTARGNHLQLHDFTKAEESLKVFKHFVDIKPKYLNTMRISNLMDFVVEQQALQAVDER
jgi:hypothetical protein